MAYVAVLVTTSSQEEAQKIGDALLRARLAACVNLIPGIRSAYWWEGKIEEAEEVLMIIKTKEEAVTRLIQEIKGLHSYSVCEVVALPIIHGNDAYLKWIEDTVI
ncbi:MAG: divalent-cation tolerance protein CutA [Chloroflexi bacterium]|nr:divalent-cation tolerance protein CutA [Chloroflexota bacterium]